MCSGSNQKNQGGIIAGPGGRSSLAPALSGSCCPPVQQSYPSAVALSISRGIAVVGQQLLEVEKKVSDKWKKGGVKMKASIVSRRYPEERIRNCLSILRIYPVKVIKDSGLLARFLPLVQEFSFSFFCSTHY